VPAGHDPPRARRAAPPGGQPALLDPARDQRLLRQANAAAVGDARKLDDDTFEVSPHKSDLALPRGYVPAQPAEPADAAAGNGGGTAAPLGATGEYAARAPALRFRRGSRSNVRLPDFPLIGMVQVEDDAVPAPAAIEALEVPAPKAKPARRAKRPAGAAASPAVPAPAAPAAASEASPPPKRRSRPRAKKKAE
jgi:2-oxoglutarate dehydrogenase E2 component (dihydrolipoamide succinyltransferase)